MKKMLLAAFAVLVAFSFTGAAFAEESVQAVAEVESAALEALLADVAPVSPAAACAVPADPLEAAFAPAGAATEAVCPTARCCAYCDCCAGGNAHCCTVCDRCSV